MKPLQTLDQVMLWVARVFSVYLALFFAYWLWAAWTDDDLKIIYNFSHDISEYINLGILSAQYGLLFSIWIVCAWHKLTNITRTLMGLSAGIVELWLIRSIALQSPTHTAIVLGMGIRHIIGTLVFPCWTALGLLSMVWLAIHALRTRSTNSVQFR